MRVDAFDFDLPRGLIAQHPVVPRDAARMLEVSTGVLHDRVVGDLPRLLAPGDVVVLNDTRVIPARLVGRRGGAKVAVTLHKAVDAATWRAFARPAKRLRVGDAVAFGDDFTAQVTAKGEAGEVTLRFDLAGAPLMDRLGRYGAAPLPPYIRRPDGPAAGDRDDYQTVYARHPGAVAAPTAGLHFTPALLDAIIAAGAAPVYLTLHVGAGTFLPVKAADTRDHRMHAESGRLDAAAAAQINAARAAGGRILAVGTTCLRLLESAADEAGQVRPFAGDTDIFITPGHSFRTADLLLTNFHLPRSTLFMLVAAFAGLEPMHAAYQHAIAAGYRFYSYGDCCLLRRAGP